MPVLTVPRKPLTLAERTYIPQILSGMWTTLRHIVARPLTLNYPEQRPEIPPGYRGAPTLVRDPDGREKCVSCQLCEFACPCKAIRITPGEIPPGSPDAHIEKAPREFEIDMLRCSYCGFCQEACPEEAIVLQNTYSLTSHTRAELIHNKQKLYALGGTLPDPHRKWTKKKTAAEEAALHGQL